MRRKPDPPTGRLASTIAHAFLDLEQLKRDGVDEGTRARMFEGIVRDVWPSERPWKYVCDECSDTGWQYGICRPNARCGRPFRLPKQATSDYTGQGKCMDGHSFVRPCFCEKGRAIQHSVYEQQHQPEGDDLARIGKVKKPSFSRFGR